MNNYSLGFMFDTNLSKVALIQKARPVWQEGKWNGIGGKIELDESSLQCMTREFYEEAGIYTYDWTYYLTLIWAKAEVHVFWAINDLTKLITLTDESVRAKQLSLVMSNQIDTIDNLQYLIPLALQSIKNTGKIGEHK